MNNFPILIYDNECNLCRRFKLALEVFDRHKKINFIALQDEQIYKEFQMISKQACEKDIHLIVEKDQILVGADALKYLISLIPAVSKISWLIEKETSAKLSQAFYKQLGKIRRYQKGCRTC